MSNRNTPKYAGRSNTARTARRNWRASVGLQYTKAGEDKASRALRAYLKICDGTWKL